MSKSKQRLLEINAMLADNVSAKGVQASKDETTTSLVHKVEQIKTAKPEQEKTVTINKNGTTDVLPDEGKTLSRVNVEVSVPSSGGDYTNEQITSLIGRTITEFTIPDGCSEIGYHSFRNCTTMKNIFIPNSVTKINGHSFIDCTKLSLNELPNSVTTIGNSAFENCYQLLLQVLPSNLSGEIGQYTFNNCKCITINEIPQGVSSIERSAFNGCIGITDLTFKGIPTSIYSNSFRGCTNLLNIYVPWSEGEVANAPWGATNATIHYNSEV